MDNSENNLTVREEDVNLLVVEYISGHQEATLYLTNREARELISKLSKIVESTVYTKILEQV